MRPAGRPRAQHREGRGIGQGGIDRGSDRQSILRVGSRQCAGGSHGVRGGRRRDRAGGVESISMIQRDGTELRRQGAASRRLHGDGRDRRGGCEAVRISREAQDDTRSSRAARAAPRASSPANWRQSMTRAVFDKRPAVPAKSTRVDRDECNRPDTTLDGLTKLPPVFDPTSGRGSVTAGNSSQLSDGASATLVMSMSRAKALGLAPLLLFRGFAVSGCGPDEMGVGPVFAVPKLLSKAGVNANDVDVWEPTKRSPRRCSTAATRRHSDGEAQSQRRIDRDRPSVRHDRIASGGNDRE